jgi:hypothetical protein
VKTWFLRFIRMFWNDAAFFERMSRAVLMGFALSGVAFGHQVAELLGAPKAGKWIVGLSIVAGFLSKLVAAGEKNATASPPAAEPSEQPAATIPAAGFIRLELVFCAALGALVGLAFHWPWCWWVLLGLAALAGAVAGLWFLIAQFFHPI